MATTAPQAAPQSEDPPFCASESLVDARIDDDLRIDGFDPADRYPEHGHDALRTAYRSGYDAGHDAGHDAGNDAATAEDRHALEALRGDVHHLLNPIVGYLRRHVHDPDTTITTVDLEYWAAQIMRATDRLDAALGEEPMRTQLARARAESGAREQFPDLSPETVEAGADRPEGRVCIWRARPKAN